MRGSPYAVIVCDLFHAHAPDHETLVEGFPTQDVAVEYARRRTWSSVEQFREPGLSPEQVLARWRAFGEDCRVVGPEGVLYVASSEMDRFLAEPLPPHQRDWVNLYRSLLPEDFRLVYEWRAGTYPPPYHYEYVIQVGPGDSGEITFWPDYPGENVVPRRLTFHPDLTARIKVYNFVRAMPEPAALRSPGEEHLGGETGLLEVSAEERRARVWVHQLPEEERLALHQTLRAIVPEHVWKRLLDERQ